jgi:hypothetical protein
MAAWDTTARPEEEVTVRDGPASAAGGVTTEDAKTRKPRRTRKRRAAEKSPKKKTAAGKRKKKAAKKKKAPRGKKSREGSAARMRRKSRAPAPEATEAGNAKVGDAVEASVHSSVLRSVSCKEADHFLAALRVVESLEPFQREVATKVAREPYRRRAAKAEERAEPEASPAPGDRDAAAPAGDIKAGPPNGPPRHSREEPRANAVHPEELSPDEAVRLLTEITGVAEAAHRARRPRPPGSVIMPSCKVIAFESAQVNSEMRVAGSTLARLYGMVRRERLDLDLGRICQTIDDLIGEWDSTALDQSMILLVNLIGAEDFLEGIVSELPEVTEAYWIVYETLRGEVTSSRHRFLSEQKARRRAKAIGFGPRNVVAAARAGAEAVRWRVEWGFGGALSARAS